MYTQFPKPSQDPGDHVPGPHFPSPYTAMHVLCVEINVFPRGATSLNVHHDAQCPKHVLLVSSSLALIFISKASINAKNNNINKKPIERRFAKLKLIQRA